MSQSLREKLNIGLFLGVLFGLTSCAGNSTNTNTNSGSVTAAKQTKAVNPANAFKISFDWPANMKECFSKVSPPITLSNVPTGTTSLTVVMVDEDAPSFDHGGGKVNYSGGSVIPAGALKRWQGPCPPSQHKYTFKVTANGGAKARAKTLSVFFLNKYYFKKDSDVKN